MKFKPREFGFRVYVITSSSMKARILPILLLYIPCWEPCLAHSKCSIFFEEMNMRRALSNYHAALSLDIWPMVELLS